MFDRNEVQHAATSWRSAHPTVHNMVKRQQLPVQNSCLLKAQAWQCAEMILLHAAVDLRSSHVWCAIMIRTVQVCPRRSRINDMYKDLDTK